MRVATHLEHNQHKHEERHEEVQAVKLRDAAEHERDDRNAAIRVAILACKNVPPVAEPAHAPHAYVVDSPGSRHEAE